MISNFLTLENNFLAVINKIFKKSKNFSLIFLKNKEEIFDFENPFYLQLYIALKVYVLHHISST